ncbi:MAG: hypothetical protein KF911_12315 [Pseudomonadales bacterium]|nr:hypothetical protein [Pseudomonadales bacterium]
MNARLMSFGLALMMGASSAFAASVQLAGCGINALGCFTADASYEETANHRGRVTGTMSLAVTNTGTDGWLTGIAFNNPSSSEVPRDRSITGVSMSGPSHFRLLGGSSWDDQVNASPFGRFDIGASTGSNFHGGGNPSRGIGAGQTGIFTFTFTGPLGVSIADFFGSLLAPTSGEYSEGSGIGSYGPQVFAVRFMGFDNGGSDMAYGSVVPIPPALVLFLSGFGLLVGYARRRRATA